MMIVMNESALWLIRKISGKTMRKAWKYPYVNARTTITLLRLGMTIRMYHN